MLKQRYVEIGEAISLHFGEEEMWYLTPTMGFQRVNWEKITNKKETTHLIVVKWLKYSAGVIIKYQTALAEKI